MKNEDSIKEWKNMGIVRAKYNCAIKTDSNLLDDPSLSFFDKSGVEIKSEFNHHHLLIELCHNIIFSGIKDNYPQDCNVELWNIDIKLNESNDEFLFTSSSNMQYIKKICDSIECPELTIQTADFMYDYIEQMSGDWTSFNVKYKNDTPPPDIHYFDGNKVDDVIGILHHIFCDHLNEWEWEQGEPTGFGDYYSVKIVDENGRKSFRMDVQTCLYEYEDKDWCVEKELAHVP